MENTERDTYLPQLTDNEYEVMLIFWRENRPLSSVDIRNLSEGKRSFHFDSILQIMGRLLKKGYIEHDGYVKGIKHISETFRVRLRQEDFHLTRFEEVHAGLQEKSEAAFGVITAFLTQYCNVKQERLGLIRDFINEKTV